MRVAEIMRKPVGTLSPETTVAEALARMHELGVTLLPIEDADEFFSGIVTVAELSRRSLEAKGNSSDPVKGCPSAYPVTATPEMDVGRLAEMMRNRGLEHIVVLDRVHVVGALSLVEATAAHAGTGPS
jgi:CBS domain-containing protein